MERPPEIDELHRTLGVAGVAEIAGDAGLDGALPGSALAELALTALASSVSELSARCGFADARDVRVDRGLCDVWLGGQAQPQGWTAPSPWDPLSGAFATAGDAWIRTHANAPRHRRALLRVLDLSSGADAAALARAIAPWEAVDLERAIVDAGGAAGALRSRRAWEASAAGRAVAGEPLVARDEGSRGPSGARWEPEPARPLAGLRVLDLTRVIAGPAATQVLAGLGADVLRVDPPDWDEPAVLPAVMAGKRTTRLDASQPADRERLMALLSDADVLVSGYRAGVLDRLGIGAAQRHRLRPGLVEVGVRAYGWTGPWAGRRGFDSIVQFSTGIAHRGMLAAGAPHPVSLPVQALDWSTGYLAAAAAIAGIVRRLDTGRGSSWRLSLARTARTLQDSAAPPASGSDVRRADDVAPATVLDTPAGALALATSPFTVGPAALRYDAVATRLGVDEAEWR